eukprot:scaffold138624_cov16-Tisochrysis_lutea.AAC.1
MDVTCRARPSAPAADSKSTPGPSRPAKKKSKKLVDINGEVVKDLGNGMFQIKLENGVGVMGHLSGKIRQNRIRIVTGDKVRTGAQPDLHACKHEAVLMTPFAHSPHHCAAAALQPVCPEVECLKHELPNASITSS